MESSARVAPGTLREAASLAGLLAFFALAAGMLLWAKWSPYTGKIEHLWSSPHWTSSDLLDNAGNAGSAPSPAGAWAFTRAYFTAILPALLAALVIASGLQALVPQRWVARTLSRGGNGRSALLGGLVALPSLMCTCCTAPVAVTLRRRGAPASATLAYWVGNPVLNPVVLVFLLLVAPWQWTVTRLLAGAVLVFGASALVARLDPPRPAEPPALEDVSLARAPGSFVRSFATLALRLLPEYLVVVFLVGLFRGWLLPLGASAAHWPVLAAIAAAVLGTLIVIPTAGEIPILLGLSAVGIGSGAIGALLITLPAISLVSMAMVARTFSPRVTLAMAGAVAACGLLGAVMLWALGS